MISVIIPTLWKPLEIKTLLEKINSSPFVGEIILINNDASNTPDYLSSLAKIKIIDFGKNIYVNPAWNIGVKESKFDKICLLSDDVLFDEEVFKLVNARINSAIGTIGPHGHCLSNTYARSPFMEIVPSDKFWHGYGTLLFLHKQNYIEVPKEFQINFGDRWQYDYNAIQKRQNYFITQFVLKTTMGTTSKLFNQITEEEERIHREVYLNLKKYEKPGLLRSALTVKI